jgi:hypothetical protein
MRTRRATIIAVVIALFGGLGITTPALAAPAAPATSGTTATATVTGWETCNWKILPGMSSKTNFCVDWVPSKDAYGNQVVRSYGCKVVNNDVVNVIIGAIILGRTYDGYIESIKTDGTNYSITAGSIGTWGCGTLRTVWVPDPDTAHAGPLPDGEVFVNFYAARSGRSYVPTTVYDTNP